MFRARQTFLFSVLLFFHLVMNTAWAEPDGNNSRIQALESEIIKLHQLIDDIQLIPGPPGPPGPAGPEGAQGVSGALELAGKSCAANLAVVGFDNNGNLICAAPWNIPQGGEPTTLAFTCEINYDQTATEVDVLGALAPSAFNSALNQFAGGSIGDVTYTMTFDPILFDGPFTASAPLVELTEAEPCADAIGAAIGIPGFNLTGSWQIVFLSTTYQGTFAISSAPITVDTLATLLPPDISAATPGTIFNRTVESYTVVGYSAPNIDIQINDPSGVFAGQLALISNTWESDVMTQVINAISTSLEPQLLSLPAPVTVTFTTP